MKHDEIAQDPGQRSCKAVPQDAPAIIDIDDIFCTYSNINIIKHSHWSYDPIYIYTSPIIPIPYVIDGFSSLGFSYVIIVMIIVQFHLFLSQLWLVYQNKHLNRGDEIQIPHTSSTLQTP